MNILRIVDVVVIVLTVKFIQNYLQTYQIINALDTKNSTNRIIDSDTSYCVSITTKPSNKTSILCTGTFITRKYVLTAAHCLEGSKTAEVTTSNVLPSLILKSNQFKIHPKWRPKTLSNDVALIKVPTDNLEYQIKVIDLFTRVKTRNKVAKLYGWIKIPDEGNGVAILKTHEVVVITNEECEKDFGVLVRNTNICTKPFGVENGCHGFSGGPLIVEGTQIGVVSFGTTNCHLGYPTIHTKISKYRKWIQDNTDDDDF